MTLTPNPTMPRLLTVGLVATIALLVEPGRHAGAEPSPDARALLDVPFLPQGRLLCGGASVAMVQRYWGEQDVYAEDFEHLVDGELGGISTADLVRVVRGRGWNAFPIRADREAIRHHLSRGRPLIALLRASGNAFHYVVLTGWMGEHLVLHDPSVGPFRLRTFEQVRKAWEATDFWTLLVLPATLPETSSAEAVDGESVGTRTVPRVARACDSLLSQAVGLNDDLPVAGELLSVAAEVCPDEAAVFRELAAVRFREKQWSEAVRFAERAVELDRPDEHSWLLLGASRFLNGDRDRALTAWNQRGSPTIDVVSLGGLARTRQEVIYRYLSLKPGTLLTADDLRMARRRASDLPTVGPARVSFEPVSRGRAKVTASLNERELFDPLASMILQSSVDAVTERVSRTVISSPTGGGERLEAGLRWWDRRPAFWLSLDAPGMLGLPGIVTLDAQADRQDYALPSGSEPSNETRRAARIGFSDWLSSETKAELGVGIELFRSQGEWIQLRGAIEHRFASDHLSLRADASRWFSVGAAAPFAGLGVTLAARSTTAQDETWTFRARLDARSVSDEAPLATWPGAGIGRARPLLLRAYPLLKDGTLSGDGFGRQLLHGTVEAERTAWEAALADVGVATFLDWAWIGRVPGEPARALSSAGVGLRLHLLGRTLRLDGATRLGRGGIIFSAGWVESW